MQNDLSRIIVAALFGRDDFDIDPAVMMLFNRDGHVLVVGEQTSIGLWQRLGEDFFERAELREILVEETGEMIEGGHILSVVICQLSVEVDLRLLTTDDGQLTAYWIVVNAGGEAGSTWSSTLSIK